MTGIGSWIGSAALGPSPGLLAQAAQAQRMATEPTPVGWCPAWAFWVLASLTIIGALVTITRRNLIGAVMSLVATFFGLASIYALLSAHFLAAIQVLVYAGAVMVLFVFVVMVLNREEEEPWSLRSPVLKAFGTGAVVYLLVRLGEVLFLSPTLAVTRAGQPPANFGSVAAIADYFFTRFLFPFEAISILLIIAVIGAVVLTRSVAKPTSVHDLPLDQQPRDPAEDEDDGHGAGHGAAHGAGGH